MVVWWMVCMLCPFLGLMIGHDVVAVNYVRTCIHTYMHTCTLTRTANNSFVRAMGSIGFAPGVCVCVCVFVCVCFLFYDLVIAL